MSAKKYRLNREIRAPEVRVITDNDEHFGIMPFAEALRRAEELAVDLVEVSPNAVPPVCKIMDFGKFLYRQRKAEQKQKKMQKKGEVKGIRLTFRIGEHDMEVKANQARKFLENSDSVKVSLIFKGREGTHASFAMEKMNKFAEMLKEHAKVEEAPKRQGNTLMMLLLPINKGKNVTTPSLTITTEKQADMNPPPVN